MATTMSTTTILHRKIKKLSLPDRLFPKVPELLNDSGRMKPLSSDLTILPTWNTFHSPSLSSSFGSQLSHVSLLWTLSHHLAAPCTSPSQNFSSCGVITCGPVSPSWSRSALREGTSCVYHTSAFQSTAPHECRWKADGRLLLHHPAATSNSMISRWSAVWEVGDNHTWLFASHCY